MLRHCFPALPPLPFFFGGRCRFETYFWMIFLGSFDTLNFTIMFYTNGEERIQRWRVPKFPILSDLFRTIFCSILKSVFLFCRVAISVVSSYAEKNVFCSRKALFGDNIPKALRCFVIEIGYSFCCWCCIYTGNVLEGTSTHNVWPFLWQF